MGARPALIIPLEGAGDCADHVVGGKARGLGRLISAGYRVPVGFCIGVAAYEQFVTASGLEAMVSMELQRKPLEAMRWEEIWDAALRIRSAFLSTPMPAGLADAIVARHQAHEDWKKVYKEQFIPFAHGVRRFGHYDNDALQPADPYAFVALLEHQPMIATARNAALSRLADIVRRHPGLAAWLAQPEASERASSRHGWNVMAATLAGTPGGDVFRQEFDRFVATYMDLVFDGESLDERPDLVLGIVRQLAEADAVAAPVSNADSARIREEQFLAACATVSREATACLRTPRRRLSSSSSFGR